MINEKELRIGNKIKRKDSDTFCTVNWGIIKEYELYEANDYEPIPLTPEILESCRFEKDEEYFNIDDFYIKQMNGEGTHFMLVVGVQRVGKFLLYLHQLQNLYYWLTGVELEIKLPIHA